MATPQPAPTPSPEGRAHDRTPEPPLVDSHPADPKPTGRGHYAATDAGAGVTTDSLQAWQNSRGEFGTFVRADVTGVAGAAGPPYAGRPGAAPVPPSLVLTVAAGSWP